MTASEPPRSPTPPALDDGARSITQRALDVLVYLPAGALLGALEDVPDTVTKGRARVDQELRNARLVGRFVVDLGVRQLTRQFHSLAGGGPSTAASPGREEPIEQGRSGRTTTAPRERHRAPGRGAAAARPRPTTAPRDPEVDRAIPDYDILAASQVVRRLDGLGHDELRAVVRHERATRGRRTILHRAEQLLGTVPHDHGVREPAGPDASAAGPPGASGRSRSPRTPAASPETPGRDSTS